MQMLCYAIECSVCYVCILWTELAVAETWPMWLHPLKIPLNCEALVIQLVRLRLNQRLIAAIIIRFAVLMPLLSRV